MKSVMLIDSEKIVTRYFFLLLEKYLLANIPGIPKSFCVMRYFLPACHLERGIFMSLCCFIASMADTLVALAAGMTADTATVMSEMATAANIA